MSADADAPRYPLARRRFVWRRPIIRDAVAWSHFDFVFARGLFGVTAAAITRCGDTIEAPKSARTCWQSTSRWKCPSASGAFRQPTQACARWWALRDPIKAVSRKYRSTRGGARTSTSALPEGFRVVSYAADGAADGNGVTADIELRDGKLIE